MSAIIHSYLVLSQLRDELSTYFSDELATITGSNTATGSITVPTLTLPSSYTVTKDTAGMAGTYLNLYLREPLEEFDEWANRRDTKLPCRAEVHFRVGPATRERAYTYGLLYARALDETLVVHLSGTSAHQIDVLEGNCVTGEGQQRFMSTAFLDFDVWVATERRDT